ncbi:MAG: enoyl-CoA hydratase/isomerase family protein, partial [Chloroflexi bacterium]|nr:enoyl-CoA hydratase/isomerase family protein [Chloroflexota bacterium]
MSELILYEVDSDGIGLITVNRPEVRNALNWAAMEQLADVVQRAEADDDLRVLLMTGQGRKAFIAGGDLRDLHNYKTREDAYRQHDLMADTMARLTRMPVPVIAALEGATRGGGCEVALAADIRVAASDATLAFSQVRMGLTPGWGGARRLYSLVGYRTAMDY